MSNPTNTSISIQTATILPGSTNVDLTYSNGNGNVTESTGQGVATITYSLNTALVSAGWTIVGAVAMPPLPVDITWTLRANGRGNALDVSDTATVSDELDFRIQLAKNGIVYTSSDPVICNQPPV